MKKAFLIFLSCIPVVLSSCGGGAAPETKPVIKQLNISILIDLSDRIDPVRNPAVPEHYLRDIENIKIITEYFKRNMEKLTAWRAKGKIRVFFTPIPPDPSINAIASNLNIDCSAMDNKQRKQTYDTISGLFTHHLANIYQKTIRTSQWHGSDIWRFFKNDVKNYCIDSDSVYRNILIVFTDGYVYHRQSVYQNANRFSYLLGNNVARYRKSNWKELANQNDFGLMTERNDLSNLEVLILELNAEKPEYKIDEDILQFSLEKWLNEMQVSKYEVYSSDLPSNTKTRIEGFLDK